MAFSIAMLNEFKGQYMKNYSIGVNGDDYLHTILKEVVYMFIKTFI